MALCVICVHYIPLVLWCFGEMGLSVMRGKWRKWQGSDCLQQGVEQALEWDVGLVGLDGVIRMKNKTKLAFSFWITNHGANLSNFGSRVFFSMMSPQF